MPGIPPPLSWDLDEPGGHPHPKLPNVSEPERLKSLKLHCCSLHSQVAGEQTLISPPSESITLQPVARLILNLFSVIEGEGHASRRSELLLVIQGSSFQFILGSPAAPMLSPSFGCIFQCCLLWHSLDHLGDCLGSPSCPLSSFSLK